MIGYVTLGTNDLPRAVAFYDELLGVMGAERFMEVEDVFVAWAVAPDKPAVPPITRLSLRSVFTTNSGTVAIQFTHVLSACACASKKAYRLLLSASPMNRLRRTDIRSSP